MVQVNRNPDKIPLEHEVVKACKSIIQGNLDLKAFLFPLYPQNVHRNSFNIQWHYILDLSPTSSKKDE